MYWEYFGFEENPFSISPDPRYLYMSKRHQEALAHLVYGIGEAGGFVLLSGEVGTGKTTICRSLIEQLPDNVDLAFVLNPRLNDVELLATICDEMAVSYPRPNPSLKVLVDRLNEHLLRAYAIGRQPVLLIDEAQNLDSKVLEQIRLLTNLETNQRKLLQIVLIGQPELNELLAQPDLRQLDQRITARYHLRPLTVEETGGYIRHRLQVGGAPSDIFSENAIRRVYRATGGIPRLINILCDRCLLGAYAENKRKVDTKLVRGAAKEVMRHRTNTHSKLAAPGIFAAAAAAAAFLLIDPLHLSAPRNALSVTEADVAVEEQIDAPGPIAATAGSVAVEADAATGIESGSGAGLPEMAAATNSDVLIPVILAELPSGPSEDLVVAPSNPAATTIEGSYPLPPPPPLPVDLSTREGDAAATGEPRSPTSPPSSAPDEIVALHSPTPTFANEPNSATLDLANIWDIGSGEIEMTETGPATASNDQALESLIASNSVVLPSADHEPGARSAPEFQDAPAVDESLSDSTERSQANSTVQLAELPPLPASQAVSQPSENLLARPVDEALASGDLNGDLESALRALFRMWNYNYAEMKGLSPCKKARYATLRCMQGHGTWHELKIANRPAVITLSVGNGRSNYVVLTRLDGDRAQILLGDGSTIDTNLGALSRFWAGDFLLLWRPPAQFSRELKPGVRGEDVLWLRDRLTGLGWDASSTADERFYDDGLQEAVRRFQRQRGLAIDGVAGARTILQVNAALGTAKAPTIR